MINPAIAMLVVKAKERDLLDEAARHRPRHRLPGSAAAVGRGVLVLRTRQLVRLAASVGCGKDELLRIIESVS